MVRSINQPNRRYEKQHIQNCLIKEKEVKELKKCANKNGNNDELKDLYLKEFVKTQEE